jgi:hypothetical protein
MVNVNASLMLKIDNVTSAKTAIGICNQEKDVKNANVTF